MKIVHINFSDTHGGAAIAANRHCVAMRKKGIDAYLLVSHQYENNKSYIVRIRKNKVKAFIIEKIFYYSQKVILNLLKPIGVFSFPVLGNSLCKHPLLLEADAIYLHWINHSMVSIAEIEHLLQMGKPVFWYFHDMYPMTGGCHYSLECNKYETECNKCPFIKNFSLFDVAQKQLQSKIRHWNRYKNLHIVTPSLWLGKCAKKSAVFKNNNILHCPNIIDTDKFKPIDKKVAKLLFNLNGDKRTIMFGAENVGNIYKGWNYLRDALNLLDKDQYQCLILGGYNEVLEKSIQLDVLFTGYLHDEYSLILAYNAADILVTPSLADNFPNVILEAMSCGTPCVGFKVGGIPELIIDRETGYIANYKDADELAKGIKWCVQESTHYLALGQKARSFIINHCSYHRVLELHTELNLIKRL